jgi:hypothetical protein
MNFLYLLGKRKRESDDDAQSSLSHQVQQEVEVETLVRGEGSPLNGVSLDTTSSNTPAVSVSASSSSEASPKSTQAAQNSANTSSSSAPFPDSDSKKHGLTTLHEPENYRSAIVDIILVHGLMGNAYNTWLYEHGKIKTYWPYDLLRKDFPNARILAFGYDANVTQFWGSASSNRVGNHAEKMLGALSQLRAKTDTVL